MPSWLDEAILTAILASLGTVISKLVDFMTSHRIEEIKSNQAEIINALDDLEKALLKLKTDLAKVKQNSKDITRYQLFHAMTRSIQAGHTNLAHKQEVTKLFESYKLLGGNGELEMVYYEEFLDLPLKEEINED